MMWGRIDVHKHTELKRNGHDLHVFVNGIDFTTRCRFFDDTPGQQRAELYLHDADGHIHIDQSTGDWALKVVTEFEIRDMGAVKDLSCQ